MTVLKEHISALVLKGEIEQRMVDIDNIFKDYPEITFAEEIDRYLHNGNKISGDNIPDDIRAVDYERYRVYDSAKDFIGIYELREEVLYPVKIFYEDNK